METPNPSNLRELVDVEAEKAFEAIAPLDNWPPVKIDLGAHYALVLIGMLQLALRHPGVPALSQKVAREVVDGIRKHLPDSCQGLIDEGFKH